jgi:outer membrane protein
MIRAPMALVSVLVAVAAPAAAEPGRVLTLEEALRTAEAQQPSVRAALAQARAAQARLGTARAGYLPRLDAQAQYQQSTANFVLSPVFANSSIAKTLKLENRLGVDDTVGYATFGGALTETLYDFGRTGGGVGQARASYVASDRDAEATRRAVRLNVRVVYFGALSAKELVAVGEQTVANQRKHVDQTRLFVSAGTRPKIDLSSAELNLANAELALVRARSSFVLAKVQLNDAIGIEQDTDFELVTPAEPTEVDEAQSGGWMDEALRNRPEVARARAQLEAGRQQARLVRAGYFPTLAATASLSGAKLEDFPVGANWFVGVGLNWNLFNGLTSVHQVQEAEAAIESLSAQEAAVRLQIRLDLDGQRVAVGDARQRVDVAERAAVNAHERLQLAEGRYRAGAGDILELDDAQVTEANALAQRVQARYDLAIARARLAHALGRD